MNRNFNFIGRYLGLVLLLACSRHRVPLAHTPSRQPGPAALPDSKSGRGQGKAGVALDPGHGSRPDQSIDAQESSNEDDSADDGPDAESAIDDEEHRPSASGVDNQFKYTADISDAELQEKWQKEPQSLGSMSIGFSDEGRLINSEQFPKGDGWVVISPEKAWGTQETIEYITVAAKRVRELHPDAPPLRVNQLSAKEGGYLRPHKSHQNGRDVDLGFYNLGSDRRVMNVGLNWDLIKSLVTLADVQLILVDRKIQKILYDYALKAGENSEWLDSLFHAGKQALIKHARRHRDHFHVRLYNPRGAELGRRIAPLLALRPEHNLAMHRVKKRETLGAIALHYGTSVKAVQKANHLTGNRLKVSQVLKIPLRGPCTHCPIPPALLVPPRRVPDVATKASLTPGAPDNEPD